MKSGLEQSWIDAGVTAGIVATLCYFGAIGLSNERLAFLCVFAVGPLSCLYPIGLYHFLGRGPKGHPARITVSLQAGSLFLICAALAFTLMITMQAALFFNNRRLRLENPESETRELLQWIAQGVDPAQLGLDFAFDIFVSLGTALLAWNLLMARQGLARPLGAVGILIGCGGLTLNYLTFPQNSAQAGYLDPGPFFGLWYALLFAYVLRHRARRPLGDAVRSG